MENSQVMRCSLQSFLGERRLEQQIICPRNMSFRSRILKSFFSFYYAWGSVSIADNRITSTETSHFDRFSRIHELISCLRSSRPRLKQRWPLSRNSESRQTLISHRNIDRAFSFPNGISNATSSDSWAQSMWFGDLKTVWDSAEARTSLNVSSTDIKHPVHFLEVQAVAQYPVRWLVEPQPPNPSSRGSLIVRS